MVTTSTDKYAPVTTRPPFPGFPDEEPTVVTPRITTRELIALDPDGHYARAKGVA